MPVFEIPNSYVEGPPVTGRYHLRELAAAGDVDGNTYRNLLYVTQMIITAHEGNTESLYVGNQHVTPDNRDVELAPEDSINQSNPTTVDNYITADQGQAAPGAPTVANGAAGTNLLGTGVYRWKITFVTADGETEAGTASSPLTNDPAAELPPALSAIPTGGATVTARNIYRTAVGGTAYKKSGTIANNSGTTYTDNIPDASLTTAAPTANSASKQKVQLLWESTFPVEMSE